MKRKRLAAAALTDTPDQNAGTIRLAELDPLRLSIGRPVCPADEPTERITAFPDLAPREWRWLGRRQPRTLRHPLRLSAPSCLDTNRPLQQAIQEWEAGVRWEQSVYLILGICGLGALVASVGMLLMARG